MARARRAVAIGLAALVIGAVALPPSETLAYKGHAGDWASRPLDGVGDSPIMP